MERLYRIYRILAFSVGAFLTYMAFVGMPMKYLLTEGTSAQTFGDETTAIVALVHGWVYLVYVLVAFALSRRLEWPLGFTVLTLLAGTVPILIFWVERRVASRVAPALAAARAGSPA